MKRWWVLGVYVLVACATSRPQPSSKGAGGAVADYYPLAVGNTWSYEVQLLGGPTEQHDISITREEKGRFTDSTGNVLLVDNYGIRDEKRYLLRTPLEVGTKWNNVVSVSSYEQYAIVEAGQDCEAPAGKFSNCIVVESRNKGDGDRVLVNALTFAPRVGLIRVATALEANGKRIPQAKLELVSFEVGQGAKPADPVPAPTR